MKPETRTRNDRVCEWVSEERSRTVNWTECVPETKQVKYTVDNWVLVNKPRTITETVCVPVTVEKEVDACDPRAGLFATNRQPVPVRRERPSLLAGLFRLGR